MRTQTVTVSISAWTVTVSLSTDDYIDTAKGCEFECECLRVSLSVIDTQWRAAARFVARDGARGASPPARKRGRVLGLARALARAMWRAGL